MIHSDKCHELNLPQPQSFDTQYNYILNCILAGYNINTRLCRYVGIHNLHSLIPKLKKKKIPFTLNHGRVACPYTNEVPPYDVDIIYMTNEQRLEYIEKNKSAKA
jgi:hypothetical protein